MLFKLLLFFKHFFKNGCLHLFHHHFHKFLLDFSLFLEGEALGLELFRLKEEFKFVQTEGFGFGERRLGNEEGVFLVNIFLEFWRAVTFFIL